MALRLVFGREKSRRHLSPQVHKWLLSTRRTVSSFFFAPQTIALQHTSLLPAAFFLVAFLLPLLSDTVSIHGQLSSLWAGARLKRASTEGGKLNTTRAALAFAANNKCQSPENDSSSRPKGDPNGAGEGPQMDRAIGSPRLAPQASAKDRPRESISGVKKC